MPTFKGCLHKLQAIYYAIIVNVLQRIKKPRKWKLNNQVVQNIMVQWWLGSPTQIISGDQATAAPMDQSSCYSLNGENYNSNSVQKDRNVLWFGWDVTSIERFSFGSKLLLRQRFDFHLIHDLGFHLLEVVHQHRLTATMQPIIHSFSNMCFCFILHCCCIIVSTVGWTWWD